jgi:hypothetical protein
MNDRPPVWLEPCPFCGVHLTRSRGKINVAARCDTEECWMSDRKISVLLDDPIQVQQWNTRTRPAPKTITQPEQGPFAGKVYTYKSKDYFVIKLDESRLMQFEDEWHPAVEYRCEPDIGKTFFRALPDFRAKFVVKAQV